MIICSCNVISENQVRDCLRRPCAPDRVRDVFAALGKPPQCGRCARTITHLVKEARKERRNDNGCACVSKDETGAA